MIKNNTIYFGHGTVGVYSTSMRLVFEELRPPQEIGQSLKDMDCERLNKIEISADYNEFIELQNKLEKLNENSDNKRIVFKSYILDFTEYNFKSVEVVLKHIENATFLYGLSLAC